MSLGVGSFARESLKRADGGKGEAAKGVLQGLNKGTVWR